MVGDFDQSIANHEFVIYLQPQMSRDGGLLGAEALVRWNHPQRGLLLPNAFIEIFEKTGLIYRLDHYVWEQAAIQLKQWKQQGLEQFYISVNVSARDFYYSDIFDDFTELIDKYKINPANLKIEITETALMENMGNNINTINQLRKVGFCVEIDDFGSGYSSLNMLKNIQADVLKIDMLFVREMEHNDRCKLILNSVIELSRSLGMRVITEGVETAAQLKMLTDMGCNIFQGYYYSKPISSEDFCHQYLAG